MMNQQNNNSGKGNRISVPEAKAALNNMKYEIANELGVNLKQGYNGDLSSREAGYIGGYMVKKMSSQRTSFFPIRAAALPPNFGYTVTVTSPSPPRRTSMRSM